MALIGVISHCYAQTTLSGVIKNELTLQPAVGVVLSVENTDNSYQTVTDQSGYFKLTDVEVGRYILRTQSIEYQPNNQELLITSGGANGLQIILKPSIIQLDSVTVKATPQRLDHLNTSEFSIEQTLRLPAAFFDPARAFITSTPGVIIQNDQNNNIVVNGKSPNNIKWMLEGANIVNPNHLSNAGTLTDRPTQAGGGVNLFSAQMLGSTQFLQPPYNSYYGNASSGILQMNLREGEKQDRFVGQASLLGLDAAMEGAIGERTTFIANGRYSTVGILTGLGLDFGGESINFYDGAFTIQHEFKNGGSLKTFGFGGFSRNQFEALDRLDWEEDKDSTNIDFNNQILGIGLRTDIPIKKGKLSFTAIYSTLNSNRQVDAVCGTDCLEQYSDYALTDKLLSGRLHLERQLFTPLTLHAGVIADLKHWDILASERVQGIDFPFPRTFGQTSFGIVNPYASVEWNTKNITIELGGRISYSTLYEEAFLEPRISMDYLLGRKATLSLSYDKTTQYLPIDAVLTLVNFGRFAEIDPIEVDNFILGGSHTFGKLTLTHSVFLNQFRSVPLYGAVSEFNRLNEFVVEQPTGNSNAETYGYNISVQRPFIDDFFFIASGAYFKSSANNRATRYDGGYTFSFTAGKEYLKMKKDRKRFFSWNSRFLWAGGLNEEPIDLSRTIDELQTVYNHDAGFVNQLNDYFRLDLRLSWRKEKSTSTRTLALDIQNLLSIENEAYSYYDFRMGRVVKQKQLGIIPILVYRVEF